jgi:tRNA threonylcarbamoyladenosine modification (KEOPS) complex  Pcc1 subunit
MAEGLSNSVLQNKLKQQSIWKAFPNSWLRWVKSSSVRYNVPSTELNIFLL